MKFNGAGGEWLGDMAKRAQYAASHRRSPWQTSGLTTPKNGGGQRLAYSPLVITILGVMIQILGVIDQSNITFWVITAVSVAVMIADFTKVISRSQMESVVHAFVWVRCLSPRAQTLHYPVPKPRQSNRSPCCIWFLF